MSDLKELRKACAAKGAPGDSARIAAGPTVTYCGKPVAAPDGTVALLMGNGPVAIIREEDVRSVRQRDGFYLVEVPKGATILVRQDRLLAAGTSEGCCSGGTKPVALVSGSAGDKAGKTGGVVIEDLTVCDYHEICLDLPLVGRVCVGISTNCTTTPGPL